MADIAKITLKGESEAKNFIDEALRGDIAYEELSTTVSKAGGYVAGDHLIYLGQYYEVVADIAQGSTIVTSGAGQNVEEREVGDEIKKNKTQVVAQMQTLTSAFANNVNENGSKNLCPYEDTLSVPTTNTAGQLLASVELKAGDKITFVCTQDNAMTSNVRNTLIIDNPSSVRSFESVATNNHLSAGLHVMEYTATESGVHKFGIWANTISTATTYSKFMICYTDVYNVNPDYVPYAKTNQQLTQDSVTWDDLSEVGAVNLLQNNATTQTINGVTFTANSDRTIIANGANTSTSAFGYEIDAVGDNFVLPAGSYKLTGCPSNGGDSTWRLQAYKTDGTTAVAIDNGNGAMFTLTEPTQLVVKIRIGGSAGSGTLTNLTFKPMLTDPSYNGPYVPPAMTNKELTDIVTNKILLTKQSSVKATADGTKTYATLLVEAITALRSVIGNLASNERLKPIRIGIYGMFTMPIAYEIFFDKTNTSANINFVGNIVSANVYQTIQIQANNTGNIYIYRSDNGNIIDRGSEVPASGNFIEIIYEIYTFT